MTTTPLSLGTLLFDPSQSHYAPMPVNLKPPPSFALLGFTVVREQYIACNFHFYKQASRLSQVGGKMVFMPNADLNLLVWCTGTVEEYPGVFLQSLVIKDRTYHIFDRTNYGPTGEVL